MVKSFSTSSCVFGNLDESCVCVGVARVARICLVNCRFVCVCVNASCVKNKREAFFAHRLSTKGSRYSKFITGELGGSPNLARSWHGT